MQTTGTKIWYNKNLRQRQAKGIAMFRIALRTTDDRSVVVLYATSVQDRPRLKRMYSESLRPFNDFELTKWVLIDELLESGKAVLADWGPPWLMSSVLATLTAELGVVASDLQLRKAHGCIILNGARVVSDQAMVTRLGSIPTDLQITLKGEDGDRALENLIQKIHETERGDEMSRDSQVEMFIFDIVCALRACQTVPIEEIRPRPASPAWDDALKRVLDALDLEPMRP